MKQPTDKNILTKKLKVLAKVKSEIIDTDLEFNENIYGEVETVNLITKTKKYYVETESFTKVFNSKKNREVALSLSCSARTVFLWITYSLEENKDYLYINANQIKEEANITLKEINQAKKELVEKQIIAISNITDVYWINPTYIFNGCRMEKYGKNLKLIKDEQ